MIDPYLIGVGFGIGWTCGYGFARAMANKKLALARKESQRMNNEPRPDDLALSLARRKYIIGFCDGAIMCATGKIPPDGLGEKLGEPIP